MSFMRSLLLSPLIVAVFHTLALVLFLTSNKPVPVFFFAMAALTIWIQAFHIRSLQ